MRLTTLALVLVAVGLAGCEGKPQMRDEPVEVKGTVKLLDGASPKDLTVSFFPQQNTPPAGAKVAADGSFSLSMVPGKYSVYFQDEANAKVPAYNRIPQKFRNPSPNNTVSVSGGETLTVEVK